MEPYPSVQCKPLARIIHDGFVVAANPRWQQKR
jgi:hypothetical protein